MFHHAAPIARVCQWVGDNEGCRCPTIYGKAYCETHYERIYITVLPEMADYIINKELKETDEHSSNPK